LKVLPFAATLDPRHLQRFQNEARAAACLHHPNIVTVYAVGCERGVYYYAMQFINGQNLAAVMSWPWGTGRLPSASRAPPS
jgi:serine/threonine protein kinase